MQRGNLNNTANMFRITATQVDSHNVRVSADQAEVLGDAFQEEYATREEAQDMADTLQDEAEDYFPGAQTEYSVVGDEETTDDAGEPSAPIIQQDLSGGQGHCWQAIDSEHPAYAEIQDQIADGMDSATDYVAENGQHYRW